ncbi:MAG: signal recognition particle-docking protein FtsY [Clostridiales bacterium]|nr:signal recognition particle-docking protein FtsY [Clostridiales bacterium]
MEKQTFFQKLRKGMGKTRDNWFSGLFTSERLNDEFYEELEEALILADAGMETACRLTERLRAAVKANKLETREQAREQLTRLIAETVTPKTDFSADGGPCALLIVGVNGVGKTTSIGKIANAYRLAERKVVLAAADTFRAAAAEQLGQLAERAQVPMIRHSEGSDPAAVVFDAIASYKAKGCDLLIADTAGRLHNKKNLMNELAKIRRVITRELPDVPCETLLVLDATTGQNATAQVKAFAEAAELTGLILTKLDGTAKGGIVIHIADSLGVPVRFVGVGEGIDDLQAFDPEAFAGAIL